MVRAVLVGLVPYVVMIAGVPLFNSGREVIGLPELGLWVLIWVVLTPAFMLLSHRLLPAREKEEEE